MTWTALPITSTGRFSPRGPFGIAGLFSIYQALQAIFVIALAGLFVFGLPYDDAGTPVGDGTLKRFKRLFCGKGRLSGNSAIK